MDSRDLTCTHRIESCSHGLQPEMNDKRTRNHPTDESHFNKSKESNVIRLRMRTALLAVEAAEFRNSLSPCRNEQEGDERTPRRNPQGLLLHRPLGD